MASALYGRVFKSKHSSIHSQKFESTIPDRPLKYGSWKAENMEKALVAVERGMSIRKAAELHGVPRSTLHDHVSGKVASICKPGPQPYLSTSEEEELVVFLLKCAKMGYPHTRQQILAIVQQILDYKGISTSLTNGWWERFRKRNPCLTLRTAVPLSYVRAIAQDKVVIERYYDLLEDTLIDHGLLNDPIRIFNCDETGLPLSPKPLKVVCEIGNKNPSCITGDTKSQVSVLVCTSAAGYVLPPYVIFDRKTLNKDLTQEEVPGTVYGLSSSGWMDTELFKEWFLNHFLNYAPSSRPLILLMDGHSSHFCPEMIRTAADEGIVLFTLPPHTTHLLQPLDKGPFGPLKVEWRKTVHEFLTSHPGRTVSRYDFSSLFCQTWYAAMNSKNVAAGFRFCGVYPFNKDVKFGIEKDEVKKEPSASRVKTILSPLTSDRHHRFLNHYTSTPKSTNYFLTPERGTFASDDFDMYDSYEPNSMRRSFSHNDLSIDSKCFLPLKRARSLSRFLVTPVVPECKQQKKTSKSSGRVLTSKENMEIMEEKLRMKQEIVAEKEARIKAREEKKRAKEEEKRTKLLKCKKIPSMRTPSLKLK